jgi:acyl-CoA synthetase (AMP-forming)/AMP-acid ligase II
MGSSISWLSNTRTLTAGTGAPTVWSSTSGGAVSDGEVAQGNPVSPQPLAMPVSLESLVQHCRSRGLSRYKYPELLVIVDALPRNQFGKVIKKDLREAFG